MAIPEPTKLEIVQRLHVAKQRGNSLVITLRFKGETDEAARVAASTAALSTQIDTLLGQIIAEWLDQGTDIVADITRANAGLQRSITEIGKGLHTAQNVVKAIGLIDEAAAIAARIAAAVK
ncbi:MAG: hypothetical protein ACFCUO_09070 [Rhodospirillales bacterium]